MNRTMKRTALFFSVALLASPVFAAGDLCETNLQKLNDATAAKTTLSESVKTEVAELKASAEQARAAGDTKKCIETSTKALEHLDVPNEGSGNS